MGGAYVFPGGKVDAADAGADTLARLDRAPAELYARLGEPALSANQAAALYVAAAREAGEESGCAVSASGRQRNSHPQRRHLLRLRAGEPFAALLAEHGARLDTDALAPGRAGSRRADRR